MILDSLKQCMQYANLHPRFETAFNYLLNTDFTKLKPGRHEIMGDAIYASLNVYETKSMEEAQGESHKRYIDIQYMVEGSEIMGVMPLTNQVATVPYREDKDIVFYGETGNPIKIDQGMFTIFFPSDLHTPGISNRTPGFVKKVVIKVAVEV